MGPGLNANHPGDPQVSESLVAPVVSAVSLQLPVSESVKSFSSKSKWLFRAFVSANLLRKPNSCRSTTHKISPPVLEAHVDPPSSYCIAYEQIRTACILRT